MVEKLNLAIVPHPNPYKVEWLNQGKEISVNSQVLLTFSIGNAYKDQICCDVLPMDACHLLLGRPWQYDRKTIHTLTTLMLAFEKDIKKIMLMPYKFRKKQPPPFHS